jgi:hypothetical protein
MMLLLVLFKTAAGATAGAPTLVLTLPHVIGTFSTSLTIFSHPLTLLLPVVKKILICPNQ